MFASLAGYKDQAYYEEHPTLMLMIPDKNYTVALFTGYVASVDDLAWEVVFSDATCSYEFNNARYVVLGVLQES